MIQVGHNIFDPTGMDVSGSRRGQAEQGDVFANIFGSNFELASQDSAPSLPQRSERVNEQQGSEAKTAPVVVAEDEKGTSETNSETATDAVAAVDPEATDQPVDSREAVADEGEENDAGQTTSETVDNIVLLEQLAGDVKAQHTQQQVAKAEAPLAAPQVKVIVPEPVTANAGVGKIDVKVLVNEANVAKAAVAGNVVDAANESVVVENTAKLAVKDVATGLVPVGANVDQDVTVDVDDTQQEQVKTVAKNNGESLNQDVQSNARGSAQSDLAQRHAQADSEAKEAGGLIAEVVTKEQKVEVKKADNLLVSSIRAVSAGKVDSSQGSLPESKPASAESLISREQVEQVVKAARMAVSRGSSQIQLRLNPPELGLLRIEIKHSASGLQLQLQATTVKAFQLLEQTSGHLRSVLESQGFQSTQIEVQLRTDLRNDPSMEQQADQFNQGKGFQQGESFSEDFEELFEDQLADAEVDSMDAQEALETQSSSRSREGWREIEFSNFDVVV